MACAVVLLLYYGTWSWEKASAAADGWGNQRAQLLEQLSRAGGRHLVIVRYGQRHSVHDEWVYNAADIDAATVVWARAMDAVQDQQLIGYFHDRRIWLLEPDESTAHLMPYPARETK